MGADDRDRSADRRDRDAWVRDALGETSADRADAEGGPGTGVVVEMEPVGGDGEEEEDMASPRTAAQEAPAEPPTATPWSAGPRTGLAAVLAFGVAGAALAVALMVLLIQQGAEATAGPLLVGLGVLVGLIVLQTAAGVVRRTGPS